jgi:hypothetical protein
MTLQHSGFAWFASPALGGYPPTTRCSAPGVDFDVKPPLLVSAGNLRHQFGAKIIGDGIRISSFSVT